MSKTRFRVGDYLPQPVELLESGDEEGGEGKGGEAGP